MLRFLHARLIQYLLNGRIRRLAFSLVVLCSLYAVRGHAQYTWVETFETGMPTSASIGTYTLTSGTWFLDKASSSSSSPTPFAGSEEGHIGGTAGLFMQSPSLNTVGSVTFYMNTTASSSTTLQVMKSYGTSTVIGTATVVGTYT